MDPEVRTAKGQLPHDEACRSLRTSIDSFRSTPNCSHKQLARTTSLSLVRVGNESRIQFLFSESGREECSSGRNDAPRSSGFRRKVATAPSFLVAKPRVPVAKCDYAPGFFEPWAILCSSIRLSRLSPCMSFSSVLSIDIAFA